MDRIADALGIDPVRLREINALRPGDTTATGQKLGKDASALPVLREAVRRSRLHAEAHASGSGTNRGIGLSLFFHGSGFTGGGEVKLASKASLELTATRRAHPRRQHRDRPGHAHHARADRGRRAGRAVRRDRGARGRHRVVPDSGPTVASRTCMIVGKLLERCARDMRKRLGTLTPAQYFKQHGSFTVTDAVRAAAGPARGTTRRYRGDAYGSYGWGCNVVELEVDPVTCEVTPLNVTAVAEIGKAIHPMMAEGQIEGGTRRASAMR